MVSWMPKRHTIEDDIAEEEARIAGLREQQLIKQQFIAPAWMRQPIEAPAEAPAEAPMVTESFVEEPSPDPFQSITRHQREAAPLAVPPSFEEPQLAISADKSEWWEQPKVITEGAMESIGKGISKVPILPEVLEWAAPAFEFIHEKLEKPFASIITSPWSPNLSWRAGESWLEHEKREYDAWEAPTYVKGVAEFAMPLWWIPWLGWATKGAKVLGAGNKMARAMATLPKAGRVQLPSKEALNSTLYKKDFFKTAALWAEDKPILSGVVKAIGLPAAFVKSPIAGEPVEQLVKRELANRAVLSDMRNGVRGLLMPRLQKYGDPMKLFDIADDGLVRGVVPKRKGLSQYIYDVLEDPDSYRFKSAQAKAYVEDMRDVLFQVRGLAMAEGVKVPKNIVVHRIVRGKVGLDKEGISKFEQSEFGSLYEVARHHKTMADGVKAGVVYGVNPNESIASSINYYIKKIADKRFTDEIGKLGKKPMELFAEQFPIEAGKISGLLAEELATKFTLQSIKRIISHRGASIPGATMTKIKNGFPDIAERLDLTFAVRSQEVDTVISAMSRELARTVKMKPRELKIALSLLNKDPKKVLMSELTDAVRQLNVNKVVAQKVIERGYKAVYQSRKQYVRDSLKQIQDDVNARLVTTKTELKPLLSARTTFLRPYKEGSRQILGTGQAKFRTHPVFKNKIFDKEVVELTESALGAQGVKWIRDMAVVSGASRMLVAALDFSAPFIQGLAVLGRNPVAWVKAVEKQFEFFLNPQNLYKYMSEPVNMSLRAERILAGGTSQTFEFFEAMAPLQRVVGKVPKVGGLGQKAIAQSYGRAEAAFTGFGEVARNEMWKALRRPNMNEGQLREVARTIDRMTGVMSSEALAIGVVQRDIENAFIFFAPRYTRAGLSYIADVFKGGITGAEARKSLGGLMGGGLAMYYGISSALGQTPNLDPRSGKFMTIKIGDDHVGIGGMLYSLMRFGANVATTAVEEPVDLVRLNRFDNPFVRFMYQKTAPLTGLAFGVAIEQKDYLGQPFESPADWAKFLAEKVIPIAAQRAMPWEEQKITAPVFGAEILGGRTFPKSAWTLREEARDRHAQEQFGQSYKALPELYQREIDKLPDIQMLGDEADERTVQIGEALSVAFLNRQRERDDARFMYELYLNQLQKAVDVGVISSYDFREELQSAGSGLGATYEHIDRQERYNEVLEKLKEPKDISDQYIGDIAYDELMEGVYGSQFDDEFGLFQYDKYNDFREQIRRKYGDDVWSYILDLEQQKRVDLPPLAQEYYHAREVMRPYWQVRDEAIKIFGEPQTNRQENRLNRFISRTRKRLRSTNPELEKYVQMFYTNT